MTAMLRPESAALAERLLKSSARHSYDPAVDIDWSAPIPEDKRGMQPARMSPYGTALGQGRSGEAPGPPPRGLAGGPARAGAEPAPQEPRPGPGSAARSA